MDGKYDNVIKYYTRNLKLLKENNIIMFCDIDDIDSYSLILSRRKKINDDIWEALFDITLQIVRTKFTQFELIENSLKIIEVVISHQIMNKKYIDSHIREIINDFDIIITNYSSNENIVCKLMNLSLILCMSDYISVKGDNLYNVVSFLIRLYQLSDSNLQIKTIAKLTLEQIIDVVSVSKNNDYDNTIERYNRNKWIRKEEEKYLSLMMSSMIDSIEIGSKLSKPNTKKNEKGILNGLHGWCVLCRNKGSFYDDNIKFSFCSHQCYRKILLLKKIVNTNMLYSTNGRYDKDNVFILLSLIIYKYHFFNEDNSIDNNVMILCLEMMMKMLNHIKIPSPIMISTIKDFLYYILIDIELRSQHNEDITKKLYEVFFFIISNEEYRKYLFNEVYIFFNDIILKSISLSCEISCSLLSFLIEQLNKLCEDNNILIELFKNYDCSVSNKEIVCQLVSTMSVLIQEAMNKNKKEINQEEYNIRISFIDFLAKILLVINSSLSHLDLTLKVVTSPSLEYKVKIKKAIEYFNMFPLQFGKYYIDNELIINETTFNTIKINNDSTVNSVSSFLSKYYTGSNIITYDDYLAYEIALFIIKYRTILDKDKISLMITTTKPFNIKVLFYFIDTYSFSKVSIIEALSLINMTDIFTLDEQIKERSMRMFASKYTKDNESYLSNDNVFNLSLMIIEVSLNNKISLNEIMDKYLFLKDCDYSIVCEEYNKALLSVNDKYQNSLIDEYLSLDSEKEFNTTIDINDIRNLISSQWNNIYIIFSKMISIYEDNAILLKCIDNILLIARITGMTSQYDISDSCIESICSLTNIIDSKPLKNKSKLCLSSLIRFSIVNGEYISSSWKTILTIASKIDTIITKKETFIYSFDQVFEVTKKFNINIFTSFISALCEVSSNKIKGDTTRLYALRKIVEVSENNLHRNQKQWEIIYKIISEHIIQLATTHDESSVISLIAIDSLRQIVIKLLTNLSMQNNFEVNLLMPFELIFDESPISICESILEALGNIVEVSSNIKNGWIVMFTILKTALDKKIHKEIVHILKSNTSSSIDNFDNYKGFIECLCKLYIEDSEMKNYVKETLIKVITDISKMSRRKEERLSMLGLFMNTFDDIGDTMFDIIHQCKEFIFNYNNKEENGSKESNKEIIDKEDNIYYCYHCGFKYNIVCMLMQRFKLRSSSDDYIESDKDNHLCQNIKHFLSESITNKKENNVKQIMNWYSSSDEYIIKKIQIHKSLSLSDYETRIGEYINNVISILPTEELLIDLLINLFNLSLFNSTPHIIFKTLSSKLFTIGNDIDESQWVTLKGIIMNIFNYIAHTSFIPSKFIDLVQYTEAFCGFLFNMIINYYSQIINDNTINEFYTLLTSATSNIISFDIQSTLNITKAKKLIEIIVLLSKIRLIILEKTKKKDILYSKEITRYIDFVYQVYLKYNLETINDNDFFKVIVYEIENIIPKIIEIVSNEEKKKIMLILIEYLCAENYSLRYSAKIALKYLKKKNTILFIPFNNNIYK